jgi:hypothetical protein
MFGTAGRESRAAAVSQLVKPVSKSGRHVGRGTEALKRREEKVEGENKEKGGECQRSFIYPRTHRDPSTPCRKRERLTAPDPNR